MQMIKPKPFWAVARLRTKRHSICLRREVRAMKRMSAVAVIFLLATPALAQQPILKNGSCPSGYNSSGNYCAPGSHAHPAIEKNGSCPSGYNSSGAYCLMGSSGHPAIHKSGSCPSGYSSSGNYCIKSR